MVQHTSNYYYTKIQADFADKLSEVTGYEKMFFGNSGAEANECAIKIARKYSFDKYGKDSKRYNIITLTNSFHGRTLTTLSATGQEVFHADRLRPVIIAVAKGVCAYAAAEIYVAFPVPLSATGQEVFHNYFFPFTEGFLNAEANNIADLMNKIDDTVCAVMIESAKSA